ncbi:hypothetical protein L3X38_021946 [Prunus dulcis]|uniref:Uncharacterized protein n=1 Tax=Prunus dulcis TaxID=3755 RepID=A0AAD4VV12_PRUDU|nr:hypothetical protein L3X38_021946 [Prunus dulcis]
MTNFGVDSMPLIVMDVVLPFHKFPLRIFEPRYRLMVRRIMEGNRRMGMEIACFVNLEEYWLNPTSKDLIETRKIWKYQWKDHGKFCDLLAEDYFNLAFKFYEDVNVTKLLEDAGISVGMDFDPNLIIQVIRKKTKSFANIKCYNGMLWEVQICFEKDGMFRDCNMRPQDMFQNCKRKINTYEKISLPMPPTIKAQKCDCGDEDDGGKTATMGLNLSHTTRPSIVLRVIP